MTEQERRKFLRSWYFEEVRKGDIPKAVFVLNNLIYIKGGRKWLRK